MAMPPTALPAAAASAGPLLARLHVPSLRALKSFGAPRGRPRLFILALTLLAMTTRQVRAQADRIDAGSFSIQQQGHRVGREQFSLRSAPAPDGSAFELRSESVAGERRVAVQLTTDSLGSPIHYSLQIREGTRVTVRAGGQRAGGRLSTQTLRDSGESAREYALVPGMLVLEGEFYHQIAFVVRGRGLEVGQTIELRALSLLENTQRALRLSLESRTDSVAIAGTFTPALRWMLADGIGLARTIWSDAEGRLLKVVVPSRSIEVTRDALPK